MSDKYKIYEQAKLAFVKLNVKPGNLVVVYFPADIDLHQVRQAMEYMRPLATEFEASVVAAASGVSLANFDEATMRKYGWIRDPDWSPNDSGKLN